MADDEEENDEEPPRIIYVKIVAGNGGGDDFGCYLLVIGLVIAAFLLALAFDKWLAGPLGLND